MPIRPERRSLYPADWPRISKRIRERDGNRCQFCGVPDRTLVQRAIGGPWVRIVLTVAHLDHDETHNEDDNLAALCQMCHLRHDAQQHADNAAETWRRKREQAQMRLPVDER